MKVSEIVELKGLPCDFWNGSMWVRIGSGFSEDEKREALIIEEILREEYERKFNDFMEDKTEL